jgi:hypothetical protein
LLKKKSFTMKIAAVANSRSAMPSMIFCFIFQIYLARIFRQINVFESRISR